MKEGEGKFNMFVDEGPSQESLDNFTDSFNKKMEGNNSVVEKNVEEVKRPETYEEVNRNFWDKMHEEEKRQENIERIKNDIKNNMVVSIDGKSPNDNMIVSIGKEFSVPKIPEKKPSFFKRLFGRS